jgi:hypothetical protein
VAAQRPRQTHRHRLGRPHRRPRQQPQYERPDFHVGQPRR